MNLYEFLLELNFWQWLGILLIVWAQCDAIAKVSKNISKKWKVQK